jgi:Tfp pilus assembly protein FimT
MKSLALLSILALLAACAQSPTAPSTQSGVRPNLSAVAGTIRAARNPAVTGQPGASCGSANAQTEPTGFGKDGFANAESKYAGSDGTPSQAHGSSQAVSQYDVACYQLSNK